MSVKKDKRGASGLESAHEVHVHEPHVGQREAQRKGRIRDGNWPNHCSFRRGSSEGRLKKNKGKSEGRSGNAETSKEDNSGNS